MTLGRPTRYLREVAGLLGGGSVYLAASTVSGAVCGLFADAVGLNVPLWWFSGLFLPVGPLYFWFSSNRSITARLRYYRELYEAGLITRQQAAQLRAALLRWYMVRQFGQVGLEIPPEDDTPAMKPPAAPVEPPTPGG
jgi:hypothetical protein